MRTSYASECRGYKRVVTSSTSSGGGAFALCSVHHYAGRQLDNGDVVIIQSIKWYWCFGEVEHGEKHYHCGKAGCTRCRCSRWPYIIVADLAELANAAAREIPDAQFELGRRFRYGYDVRKDAQEAARWLLN